MSETEFIVKRFTHKYDDDWEPDPAVPLPETLYAVYLPHQCDSWDIAGDGDTPEFGEKHADAVEALEEFIADGQAALEALRRGEAYGNQDRW